jgi:hypothetical protein
MFYIVPTRALGLGYRSHEETSSMFNMNALTVSTSVMVNAPSGRPREIRTGRERLTVTALESVRDETAAYPLDSGPRTVFVVRSGMRRYRLVHLFRERSWTIEELPSGDIGLTRVA